MFCMVQHFPLPLQQHAAITMEVSMSLSSCEILSIFHFKGNISTILLVK
jgi:hypothetical protein